jgi:hypothetical protein
MAVKCSICYAWQPKEWNGHKGNWDDTVAMCKVREKFMTRSESCEDGRITPPPVAYTRFKFWNSVDAGIVCFQKRGTVSWLRTSTPPCGSIPAIPSSDGISLWYEMRGGIECISLRCISGEGDEKI